MFQRRSHINVNIFTTPRKLFHSLQDPNDVDSDFSEKKSRRFRSPCSSKFDYSPTMKFNKNGFHHNVGYEFEDKGDSYAGDEQFQGTSESVSSTDDVPVHADVQVSPELVPANKTVGQRFCVEKGRRKFSSILFVVIFFALIVFTSLMWIDSQDEGQHLVPT